MLRRLMLTPVLLACACGLHAADSTEGLAPPLREIYTQITSPEHGEELVGKTIETTLTLKYASEKFLIFSDAYVSNDKTSGTLTVTKGGQTAVPNVTSSYQIAKWQFAPDLVTPYANYRDQRFDVKFRILEVRTEPPYSDMPHILAEVISMQPAKKKTSPDAQ